MAKIYGINGTMTGKLGNTVMSVRNGEQVARQYQPVVYNPSTPAQVANRAKLKLMSQLSAVMAPVIAIPKQGPVSSRNLFTKVNYPEASFESDTASITLTNVKLTRGILSLPTLNATRSGIEVSLNLTSAVTDINRVVYAVFAKESDNTLRFLDSKVVSAPGDGNNFPTQLNIANIHCVVYAYGVRDNTEAARVAFGNMEAPTAETVADLIVTRTLLESDISLTITRGAELAPTREAPDSDPEKKSKK